jgi:anti-sigma B factor antagonist
MTERPSKLQISERQVDEVTCLLLTGEITVDDGDLVFGKHIDDVLRRGRVKIVANLGGVTYIDSSGVGMMVASHKTVQQHRGVLKLSNLTARSHHLMAMMKLKLVFDIFDDEAAAIKSFEWGLRL